ncbi:MULTISPECIES: histidine phosphatase family protein [unclassified Acinetobacter]|uniref:histidine phosphatase family protein n=1 Tax=unclassified Acinetobacter TaxID=196816 RepID=UPI0015D1130A|nr:MULTISPECIES: histidine phosphatase family protein [unclassified Acinetobacter]
MEHFRLDILRHGETELSHTLRGSTDDALTQKGWQQMQQTIDDVLNVIHTHGLASWDVIITSDLQRCRLFALDLSQQLKCPMFENAKFQEMHFGDWEAVSTKHIYENTPELLAQFWQSPSTFTPPNAESLQQFQQRILSGLDELVLQAQQHHWDRVLLVSHGGVIKLLKCMAQQSHLDDLLKMTAELGQLNSFIVKNRANIRILEQSE